MTDNPSPEQLHRSLEAAVPDPPPMRGLAERVEHDARRRLARRRWAVSAGAAAAVALVAVLTTLVRADHSPPTASPPSPDAVGRYSCARAAGSAAADSRPVYLRFCPADADHPTLVSPVILRTDVDQTLHLIQGADTSSCLDLPVPLAFTVQVGYADGSVTRFSPTYGLGWRFLMRAIARQEADRLPGPPTSEPNSCSAGPSHFTVTSELVSLPAVRGVRCRFDPVTGDLMPIPIRGIESIWLSALGQVGTLPDTAVGPCTGFSSLSSASLVLADGSRHSVAADACTGLLSIDGTPVGVAGPHLIAQIG